MYHSVIKDIRKPKITWVTADYFVDCDFNPQLFTGLLKLFDIHWLIILPARNARFCAGDFKEISQLPGLHVEIIQCKHRARSPKMLLFYEKLHVRIKAIHSDLVYFNEVPSSPYILPLYWRLNKKKTIVTAHDGNVKSSFKMFRISKAAFKLAFSTVAFVNMFSGTQAQIFSSNYKKTKIFVIPLGLKDFGKSKLIKRTDHIVFLFFGSIHPNKNPGLLIEAACNMYDKGIRGFKVAIHGSCSDWSVYKSKIRYPDIFECDIRLHQNSEIPDLFAQSHYVVFPYRQLSQSGALKVAFNYCTPVLTSNLEGFLDEVKNGVNGFIFESCDTDSLAHIMTNCLHLAPAEYTLLQNKACEHNKLHFSAETLVSKYIDMFNHVLTCNPKK